MLPFSRNSSKASSEHLRIKILKTTQQMSCGRKFSAVAIEGAVGKAFSAKVFFFSAPMLILSSQPLSR